MHDAACALLLKPAPPALPALAIPPALQAVLDGASTARNVTMLVPTNTAVESFVAALPPGSSVALLGSPAAAAALVSYHIVSGAYAASQLHEGQTLPTLARDATVGGTARLSCLGRVQCGGGGGGEGEEEEAGGSLQSVSGMLLIRAIAPVLQHRGTQDNGPTLLPAHPTRLRRART